MSTIESVSHEKRVFAPPAAFASQANVTGAELDPHGRGLDGGAAGVEHRGVVPEDGEVPDVAARRESCGNHRGASHFAALCERTQMGQMRGLQRRLAVEDRDWFIRTTVRDEDHILHGSGW